MARRLFELCGEDPEIRFSPFAWRSRMALVHKGLDYEPVPWRFVDKPAIAHSGQERVPVFDDGSVTVCDSWKIAEYLEDAYPDRPSLFGGPQGLALTRFADAWSATLFPRMAPLALKAVHEVIDPECQEYFRASREKMIGRPLEEVLGDREKRVEAVNAALQPMRTMLEGQAFFGGDAPIYADYIPFGIFQWVNVVTGDIPVAADDPVRAWFERVLDQHDGHARAAKKVAA